MNKNKHIQNYWMRFKVSTLTASITSLILSGLPAQIQASDIDIYQAGGTGKINIYFMLDVSGSMGSMSLKNDYGYTSSKKNCVKNYEQKKKGTWFIRFEKVGKNQGNYSKDDDDYYYVGDDKGRYKIKEIRKATDKDDKDDRYELSEYCEDTKFCQSSASLQNDLKINGYIYAETGESYCSIKSTDLDLTSTNDYAYYQKIQKICELVEGSTTDYRCLTRFSNLKKGFYQLINSTDTTKDHNFALGQYTGLSSNGGIKTLLDFTSMDDSGKKKVNGLIQNLKADGGTPIAKAYKEASGIISTGNSVSNANPQCSGNGIYFLTDGQPDPATTTEFDSEKVSDTDLLYKSGSNNTDYWQRVAGKGKSLREGGKLIKTATVGFGGEYYLTDIYARNGDFDCSVYSHPQKGLCLWGTKQSNYGKGGFYNAQSAEDLISSIKQFVSDVSVPIEGSTIGSSTIPVDALNTNQLQPFAYFPMFKPLIATKDQLWIGNLKKFNVSNGTLYDTNNTPVFKTPTDFNTALKDYWLNKSVTHVDEGVNYGGNLSQLLGTQMPKIDGSNNLVLQRKVFINDGSSASDLKSAESILKAGTLAEREYLYGLLGYSKLTEDDLTALKPKSYDEQLAYLKTKETSKGYQLGSIIHSSPILLTQKGAIVADTGSLGSVDRDDYVLFGTTQGVLHVVKSGTQNAQVINGSGIASGSGEEVFSFVPKEMLAKQKTGFFESMATAKETDNNDAFYYGIDGAWTAHTVYEPNFYDGTTADGKTVERDGLQVKADGKNSHQYVYGGLRMGGRSYYALNLSDMSKPKLMFHIDPDSATSGALSYMGQSWSKPTVAYIKWNGQRKLAMIVGGGYDMKYEDPTFTNLSSGNVKGNGIYIFDAENGKLLWWGSSNAGNQDGTATGGVETKIDSMVNSVPSRVKTVDRDGDGLVDHLYVGDLGGKVFRVDLNPSHKANDVDNKFVLNAFEFADAKEAGKNPPRFYEAPTFTIHTDNVAKKYAVISMASGDRSSPLKSDSSAQDMILGFYDYDVTKTTPAKGTTVKLTNMNEIYKAGAATDKTAGWYYRLPIITATSGGSYQTRGLSEGVALDGDLYYSIFDPSKTNNGSNGSSTSCSGGIVGVSTAVKLCLPSGKCGTDTKITNVGDLGGGIIGLNVGPGSTDGSRKLIFNKIPEICIGTDCTQNSITEYQTINKLLPTRWYDMTPYVGAK